MCKAVLKYTLCEGEQVSVKGTKVLQTIVYCCTSPCILLNKLSTESNKYTWLGNNCYLSTICLLQVSAHHGTLSMNTSYKDKLPRYHYVTCHRSSYILTNIEYCRKDAEIKEYREILNRKLYVHSFVEIIQFISSLCVCNYVVPPLNIWS